MEYNASAFLERLKDLMNDKDLNQSSLARSTGIPRRSIVNWFHGTLNPSLEYLVALATVFNCSVDYLIGRAGYES